MKKKFFSVFLIALFVLSMSVNVFGAGSTEPHVVKPNVDIQQVLLVDK